MDDLQTFITTYIGSVEQLEILILLKNSGDKVWSAAVISTHLRGNLDSVQARLQGLVNNGLAQRLEQGDSALFKYCASSPALDRQVELLRDAYTNRRAAVINMIYTGSTKPGGYSAVQELADAFKIKRGPN